MADPKKDDAVVTDKPANPFDEPAVDTKTEAEPEVHEPESDEPPVDHLASIRELALQLPNISPSGAETISQKIIAHLDEHSAKDREAVNG